jgi:inward rectifier potassium channel
LTTVGYGNLYPDGPAANTVSALEALTGLMGFAIATGLVFGRFSKPSARLGFSETMIVAPYQNSTSLQFRVANRRLNNLIDVEARILLMTVETCPSGQERRYTPLALERTQIIFFPLPWTVVHPIRENSPLYGKTAQDLAALQAEFMIVVKGFDDTFGQNVHARYSYRYDEIVWGAKFVTAFEVGSEGEMVISLENIGTIQPVPLAD